MKYLRLKTLIISVALFSVLSVAPVTAGPPPETSPEASKREIELGKKHAESLEKNPKIKFIDVKDAKNKALLDKLNTMARELGKVSKRPKIEYSVKVIEEEDPNAFTLPAGRIYFTRGMINLTGSDDELAAILSHEIGHTAMMHVLRADSKMKPLQLAGLAAMLAAMLGGKNTAGAAQMAPYILTGIANTYSVAYEKEADQAAIDQMKQTKYNPSAMVTFMQKLRDEERRRPEIELGIYQTHPATPERVTAALDALQAAGIQYTPRNVMGTRQATVMEIKDKSDIAAVQLGDVTLLQLTSLPASSGSPGTTTVTSENGTSVQTETKPVTADNASAKARASLVATRINDLLRSNLRLHEIVVSNDEDGATLTARNTVIVRATPADAKLENTTPLALAQKWKNNFGRLFWNETISGKL